MNVLVMLPAILKTPLSRRLVDGRIVKIDTEYRADVPLNTINPDIKLRIGEIKNGISFFPQIQRNPLFFGTQPQRRQEDREQRRFN